MAKYAPELSVLLLERESSYAAQVEATERRRDDLQAQVAHWTEAATKNGATAQELADFEVAKATVENELADTAAQLIEMKRELDRYRRAVAAYPAPTR